MGQQFKMLKQLQQMQARMAKIQEELGEKTVTGTAGGGMVEVVANGHQKALSVPVKAGIRFCEECFFIADAERCAICLSSRRDRSVLCVVEEPLDVLAIERTGEYHGLYHVLHGALSPIDGVGPGELKIRELIARLRREPVAEVILATDPDMEGEATAAYLAEQLTPLAVRTSRLAHGLPVGGELEYADELTLARAFSGRRAF